MSTWQVCKPNSPLPDHVEFALLAANLPNGTRLAICKRPVAGWSNIVGWDYWLAFPAVPAPAPVLFLPSNGAAHE
jgi:hypothetical protein